MYSIEYLKNYFNSLSYSLTGKEIILTCPYCGKEKHLYCSLDSGLFICFKCGTKGKVKQKDGYFSPIDAEIKVSIKELAEKLDLSFNKNERYKVYNITLTNEINEDSIPYAYLLGRKINLDLIHRYNIRYDPIAGHIIFPNKVIAKKNNLYTDFYLSRSIKDKYYKFPKGSHPKNYVYNLHNLEEKEKYIIITEGIINAITAGNKAVAIYSKFCSKRQLDMLSKIKTDAFYISLDADAKQEALRLASDLDERCYKSKIFLCNFRDDRDVNDYGHDRFFEEILFKAINFNDKIKIMLEFF